MDPKASIKFIRPTPTGPRGGRTAAQLCGDRHTAPEVASWPPGGARVVWGGGIFGLFEIFWGGKTHEKI